MRVLTTTIVFMALFAFINVTNTAQAENKCGCYQKLKTCLKQVNAKSDPCFDAFNDCTSKCADKNECLKDCQEQKKESKQLCKEAFAGTQCPLKGPESKECKKNAKQEKNKCIKRSAKTAKDCKKNCKKG